MIHRLPLVGGFDVEITLPRDLTPKEADRIAAWVESIAVDDEDKQKANST